MTELDKLEKYLKEHKYIYERTDADRGFFNRHQIIVYDAHAMRLWDAICHRGSYGYEEGLLEIMGTIVNPKEDGDAVVGWLTAEDVIKRLEVRGK